MLRLKQMLVALGAVSLLGATACVDIEDIPTDLTLDEIDDAIDCQDAIREEGGSFVKIKLRQLEQCAVELLEVQLLAESGHFEEPADLEEAIGNAHEDCEENYEEIALAQTEFIDEVADACEDAEEFVLGEGSNPLGLQGVGNPEDAEELASIQCQLKELFVDLMALFEVPRLGEGFDFGLEEEDPLRVGFEDILADLNEVADPRCALDEDSIIPLLELIGYAS